MGNLSDLLSEAVSTDFVRAGGAFVVPPESANDDDWKGEAIRRVQESAPKHAALLRARTGCNGWKLHKAPLVENDQLTFRFDSARGRGRDPMVVLRVRRQGNAYALKVEAWKSITEMVDDASVESVDLDDVDDIYTEISDALLSFRKQGDRMAHLSSDLSEALETRRDSAPTPETSGGGWDVLDEARLNLATDGAGVGGDRSNPTKSGPAAERANTLKAARAGIERMLQAIETVRGWVKNLGLGDKDKTGAAAAALRIASSEIGKVESVQGVLSSMFELPELHPGAATALDEAILFVEKRGEQSPEAVKAKEGLARMVDGLRQLVGMLRQAKLSGRVLDQVEAAINGLKSTRDAIDALSESMNIQSPKTVAPGVSYTYPPGDLYGKFTRVAADTIRKGDWVQGGGSLDTIYRKVEKIERQESDMQYVIFHFGAPYVGADGVERVTARFHKDAFVKSAR